MDNIIQMTTPINREDIKRLNIGDIIEISGTIYTARDAAHKKLQEAIDNNQELPVDLKNQFIFYAGPCPTKPGRVIGSVAPTTSMRMDNFVEMTFDKLGAFGTIGKGGRADYVAELCKKYEGVYLLSFGGAAAIISEQIKKVEVVAYEELGTESIKKLEVEKLRLIVGIDSKGRIFDKEQIAKYRK